MAVALRDLINNRKKLGEFQLGRQRCVVCDVMLQETITGRRSTPDGDACSDCYYEKLGKGVEKHPVATPGLRRG